MNSHAFSRIFVTGALAILVQSTTCLAGTVSVGPAFHMLMKDGIGMGIRLLADAAVLALVYVVFGKGRNIIRRAFIAQWLALFIAGLLVEWFLIAAEDTVLLSGMHDRKVMLIGFLLLAATAYVICRIGEGLGSLGALVVAILIGVVTNPAVFGLLPFAPTITVGRDAPTISAAMKMARGQCIVHVPAGTYKESRIDLKDGVCLKGDGIGKTIISCRLTTDGYAIRGLSIRGRIEGITIDGGGAQVAAERAAGILIDGGNVVVSGCEVRNTAGRGMGIYSEDTLVENCVVTGNMDLGIRVHPYKGNARVVGCTVRGNACTGIDAEGNVPIVIERNTIIGNRDGMIVTGMKGSFAIANNKVRANSGTGIAVTRTDTAVITANTIENNDKSGVSVWDGVEKVTISSNRFAGNSGGAIEVEAAEAEVCDNAIDGDKGGIVMSGSPQALIARNRVTGCTYGPAIGLMNVVVASVQDNECRDCAGGGIDIVNKPGNRPVPGGARVQRRITDSAKRSAVTSNPRSSKGIRKTSGGLVAITSNKCLETGMYGVAVGGSGFVNVEHNILNGNRVGGLYVWDGEDVLAAGNECSDNGGCGVHVSGVRAVASVSSNKCLRNHRAGIWFESGAGGEAVGNTCLQNGWCGIGVRNADTTPVLKANRCNDNGAWGIVTWAGASLLDLPGDNTAEGNFRGNVTAKE